MSDARTPFGRVVLVVLLIIATLGFGLAGLCGGVFTVMAIPETISPPKHGSFAGAILFISLPSLLIGGGLAWLCVRKLIRMSSSDD
ncbi:hypothetical protein ACS5PN_14940 [Roseateles sp. NT4]|uniref:hypothetical protein n=1 Tax=Roseateles sp. NT4 TaxID=3453715 RepID=UPI003EEDA259